MSLLRSWNESDKKEEGDRGGDHRTGRGNVGVANGTSKNVGLGKFWQDLEISEAFLLSLEVSFFHGLFLPF